MKKTLAVLAVFAALALGANAATITNQGQVITVQTYDDVVTATADTNVVTLVAAPAPVFVSTDTALTLTDAQAYTGVFGQQLLAIYSATATGRLYQCVGGTNWFLVK